MKRFFGEKYKDKIIVKDNEFNHMKKVLRMQEGEDVLASINDKNDYYCTIEKMDKNQAVLIINEIKPCPALPKKNIVLFQMLPKKEYLDNIIAKSVELGVSKIIPFTSEYTMVKDIRQDRVATQIMTACKQCGRSKLVEFENPLKFEKLPERLKDFDLVLFAYEKETVPFKTDILKNKQNIAIIIGNEAGFSEKESEILKTHATCISLGSRILRCDTAVTAMLSLVGILSGN